MYAMKQMLLCEPCQVLWLKSTTGICWNCEGASNSPPKLRYMMDWDGTIKIAPMASDLGYSEDPFGPGLYMA